MAAASSSTFLLCTAAILLFFVNPCASRPYSTDATSEDIHKICTLPGVDDVNFCADYFNKHPETPRVNMEGLTHMTIFDILNQIPQFLRKIGERKYNEKNEEVKAALERCEIVYQVSLDTYIEAEKALAMRIWHDIVWYEWKVEELPERCKTELSGETSNPPFVEENDNLIRLHKIALATSRTLESEKNQEKKKEKKHQ